MSVKTMGLVWDMKCPAEINGLQFKPGHKFVLIAYADHADHNGRNMWPAIEHIARKTGYNERSVQRLTSELEDMGILCDDGQGPKGTNRWYIPGGGGDKIAPVTRAGGDIPLGDIPLGDKIAPKLTDSPLDLQYVNNIEFGMIWVTLKRELQNELTGSQYTKWVEPTKAVAFDGRVLTIEVSSEYARDWLTTRIAKQAQSKLAGILATDEPIRLKFVVPDLSAQAGVVQ